MSKPGVPVALLDEITRWIQDKRYGSIQINFIAGKIMNLNRVESIKVDMLYSNSPETKVEAFSTSSCDIDNASKLNS